MLAAFLFELLDHRTAGGHNPRLMSLSRQVLSQFQRAALNASTLQTGQYL
jgi:hypothetical protein